MKTISAILLSLSLSATPAVAKIGIPQIPKAIQGTWYPSSSEGKKQCVAYRQTQNITNRISALVITPTDAKSFAEYGEYTEYKLQKATSLSGQNWRLTMKLLIEGDDPGSMKMLNIRVRLERGQLYWDNRRYFKCL
jgi:hypothetical protein